MRKNYIKTACISPGTTVLIAGFPKETNEINYTGTHAQWGDRNNECRLVFVTNTGPPGSGIIQEILIIKKYKQF